MSDVNIVIHHQDISKNLMAYQQEDPLASLFLLLDPNAGDIPLQAWLSQFEQEDCIEIYDPQNKKEACLYLLKLSANHHLILEQSIELSRVPSMHGAICGWLFSSKDIKQLVENLTCNLLVKYNATYYQFRYYDYRVLSRLVEILKPDQLSLLLGAITSWFWINTRNELMQVSHQPTFRMNEINLKLRPPQWRAIQHIPLINRISLQYQALIDQTLTAQQEQQLSKVLDLTHCYTFINEQAIFTLGLSVLIYGESLLNQLPGLIQQCHHSDKKLIELLEKNLAEQQGINND